MQAIYESLLIIAGRMLITQQKTRKSIMRTYALKLLD
jgi:hypothetical protein